MVVVRTFSTSQWLTLVFASVFLFSLGILVQNVFADTATATISLGNQVPEFIGVNPTTNEIYVSDSQYYDPNNTFCGFHVCLGKTISIINGSTDSVAGNITAGFTPSGIGVNPSTNKIYVAADSPFFNVASIDGSTNTITSTIRTVGIGATSVGVNPNTNMIYVTTDSNTVSVVKTSGNSYSNIANVRVGDSPWGVGVNPITNKIYVANLFSNTVSVIDGATNSVTSTIPVGTNPFAVAVNPNTNKIYVTLTYSVAVIDGATNNVTNTIPVGSNPEDIAVNPNTNKIYVANYLSNTVSVIDGATNSVVSTVVDNGRPYAIGINPNTGKIYVANQGSRSVTVIEGNTIPSAPQNLMATAVSSSQINLTWSAPSNNGGSTISGYMIERSTDNGTTWSTIVPNTGSTSTAFSDTGLDKKTTYTYRIHAINGVGTSPPSNIVSATTLKNNHYHHKSI